MRRCARSIALAGGVFLAACSGGAPTTSAVDDPVDVVPVTFADRGPDDGRTWIDASAARTSGVSGPVRVEGMILIWDGQMQICERAARFGCDDGIVVRGLAQRRLPRLSYSEQGLMVWPAILLEGELVDGVLTQATLPTMFRVDLDGAVFDRIGLTYLEDGRVALHAVAIIGRGQQVGIVGAGEGWFEHVDGGRVELVTPPPCPASGSCIGGYLSMDTSGLEPGVYRHVGTAREGAGPVTMTVTVEDDPGRWPPTCCHGGSVHSRFEPGVAPPLDG